MKKRNLTLRICGRSLVYLYGLFLLIPMYFILITAFKPQSEIIQNPLGLPLALNLSNFSGAIAQVNLLRGATNSVIIAVGSVAFALFNAVLVTYCIKKLSVHRIGRILYNIVILGMFIPGTGLAATLVLYQRLHLVNNFWGLILGAGVGGLPFNLFIMSGFMRTIPKELEEAAFIDGCGDLQSLFYITVPLIKPIMISIGIFTFVGSWNNLMMPLLLLRKPGLQTIPMGLLVFRDMYHVQYNYIFAGILITALPLVILYLIFQKHFVEALAGGVKG